MFASGRILLCSKCGDYYPEGCGREFIPVCTACKYYPIDTKVDNTTEIIDYESDIEIVP